MVRVDRQGSGGMRFFRTPGIGIISMNYVILTVTSCCFGLWGYLIGSVVATHNNIDANAHVRSLCGMDSPSNGWSNIQVFYGDESLLKTSTNGWYSQVKQDQVVSALFRNKQNGFFVDLASNDAVTLSNTFGLEQRLNWSGLCVEPNPTYWLDLSARRCILVGAVVGQMRMEKVSFTLVKKEFGGIIGSNFDHTSIRKGMHPRGFFTVPLLEILERNNVPRYIDYLSLDIEGAELYVMEAFPFDRYTISIITIERPKKALRDILEKNGYKLLRILSDFGETLWIHESVAKELDIRSLDSFDLPNQQTGLKDLEEMNYVYLQRNGLNKSK